MVIHVVLCFGPTIVAASVVALATLLGGVVNRIKVYYIVSWRVRGMVAMMR